MRSLIASSAPSGLFLDSWQFCLSACRGGAHLARNTQSFSGDTASGVEQGFHLMPKVYANDPTSTSTLSLKAALSAKGQVSVRWKLMNFDALMDKWMERPIAGLPLRMVFLCSWHRVHATIIFLAVVASLVLLNIGHRSAARITLLVATPSILCMLLLPVLGITFLTISRIGKKHTDYSEQHARQVSSEAAPSAPPDEPSA